MPRLLSNIYVVKSGRAPPLNKFNAHISLTIQAIITKFAQDKYFYYPYLPWVSQITVLLKTTKSAII